MKVVSENIVQKEVRAENTVPGRLYEYQGELYYATVATLACLTNVTQSFSHKSTCTFFHELPVGSQITCIQE